MSVRFSISAGSICLHWMTKARWHGVTAAILAGRESFTTVWALPVQNLLMVCGTPGQGGSQHCPTAQCWRSYHRDLHAASLAAALVQSEAFISQKITDGKPRYGERLCVVKIFGTQRVSN